MVTIPSLRQTCGVADSDLMIESGLADSTSGSIDILKLIPPPQSGGPF